MGDTQCAKGLKCFQRSNGEKIPGCKGNGGGKHWDYCYNPLHGGVKELGGGNDSKAKNLQRCVGECDADSQCAYGLKCFQRSKGEKIPGCKDGKKKMPGHYDYCYDPKTEVKKPDPCKKNNGGCDKARKCMNSNGKAKCGNCPKGYTNSGATKCKKTGPVEKNLSGGNSGGAKNLKACTGECDADSQCAKGLKCFQRSKGEKIPGCKGNGGGKDWDYCYNPLHVGVKNLSGGNSGSAKNLQRCTGECDADSQCAYGLKCFQRSKGEPIPGCKGNGGGKDWDYCYDPKIAKPTKALVLKRTTRYTKNTQARGQVIGYLDRHLVQGPANSVLTSFKFIHGGGANMRFQYTTVTFPASKVGKTVTRYTKYNDGFGRNL